MFAAQYDDRQNDTENAKRAHDREDDSVNGDAGRRQVHRNVWVAVRVVCQVQDQNRAVVSTFVGIHD